MIMASKAMLEENPEVSDEEMKHYLAGNICRCTGYTPIFNSIKAVRDSDTQEVKPVAWRDE
jgi:carbon-monoxide dehydrogenase small subunit